MADPYELSRGLKVNPDGHLIWIWTGKEAYFVSGVDRLDPFTGILYFRNTGTIPNGPRRKPGSEK